MFTFLAMKLYTFSVVNLSIALLGTRKVYVSLLLQALDLRISGQLFRGAIKPKFAPSTNEGSPSQIHKQDFHCQFQV